MMKKIILIIICFVVLFSCSCARDPEYQANQYKIIKIHKVNNIKNTVTLNPFVINKFDDIIQKNLIHNKYCYSYEKLFLKHY